MIVSAGVWRAWDIMRSIPLWLYLAGALLIGYGPVAYVAFKKGRELEQAACLVAQSKAIAKAQERAEKAEQAAGLAQAELAAYLSRRQGEIEAGRNDGITRVRTIYKDRPVPVGCERPEPVRRVLQEHIDQANAAAKG